MASQVSNPTQTVRLEEAGARVYVTGNTYPLKDRLKAAGCHWDADRKAWWIGAAKREQVASLVVAATVAAAGQASAPAQAEGVALDAQVIRGRAEYKGKAYYLLAEGFRADGSRYAKLCSRDGSLVFWVGRQDLRNLRVLKTYAEPTSIKALRAYAERRKQEDAGERDCPVCARHCTCGTGRFCSHHHDGCERCGVEG